jgi:NAD/NADP transhydrogenase alpha subunit
MLVSAFADIVLKVRQPLANEVQQFKDGGMLISFLYPGQNKDLVDQLIAKKLTAFGKPMDFSVSGFIIVCSKVNIYRLNMQE